ncbi:MAG: glutamate--cysteine ligase [Candidatus Omnitrophica bacterium]|nr:glutamate--cysteine ligase [Candidatus Omnitrophota bacterium]MBU4479232.1 glutamate--cysteine ligase [Candidatus Omnitrophota bacterium]MCG2703922.1 glutamate-cysteine ligase family protein [Candidatus Omnitrophota bacterium]
MADAALHLFQGLGIELEYMIAAKDTLAVLPVSDKLLYSVAGEYVCAIERGEIGWSNELVLHVIELKTNGPVPELDALPALFQENVRTINRRLVSLGARLLPTGMHPLMDPFTQTRLWPHDNNPIYEKYNEIFDCRGHGWANVQSVHFNLSFAGDDEFARLHAALRLILPLLPALSASSPLIDGKESGFLDTRLAFYAKNQKKLPSISGNVIPEKGIRSKREYEEKILKKMYADIAPYDKEKILQEEWLNSRGAIARFERNAIEIRIIDTQECPLADISLCALVLESVKNMAGRRWVSFEKQLNWDEAPLAALFKDVVKNGRHSVISDKKYLSAFGYEKNASCTVGQLWEHILDAVMPRDNPRSRVWRGPLELILREGSLAERILMALAGDFSPEKIVYIYRRLSECLAEGKMFEPGEK